MKNIVLGSLLAIVAVSQSTGCTVETNTPPNDLAAIDVGWQFKNHPNQTTSCPPGAPTIAQYSQPVDGNLNNIGQPEIDLWDCVDGSGVATDLVPGLYLGWVEATDDSGQNVYAQSLSAFLDTSTQDQSFDVAIFNDAGYLQLDWTLIGAQSQQPVTCAEAESGGVSVLATLTGTADAQDDVFDCEDGTAITSALLAGTYTVSVSALNQQDLALGEPTNIDNVVVQDRNEVTDLGSVPLSVEGL